MLDDAREAIRVARMGERSVAYLPFATVLKLKLDASRSWTAAAFDLEGKRVAHLPVTPCEDGIRVAQHPFTADALVVVTPA